MHEIYRTFASDFERDRMREAAAFRLASEARAARPGMSLVARVRGAIDRAVGQPAPAPTLTTDGCAAPCS